MSKYAVLIDETEIVDDDSFYGCTEYCTQVFRPFKDYDELEKWALKHSNKDNSETYTVIEYEELNHKLEVVTETKFSIISKPKPYDKDDIPF